ncbi:MAG TPA: hypothetical protein VEU73_00235 [Gemmatimonadales bacterium]|nr:hypothetical protein [Gemmatimonadales bacterium]
MRLLFVAGLALFGATRLTAQQDDRWQITLNSGTIMWELHLVRLQGDTLVVRHDDSTYRYPIMQLDELRLVRKSEARRTADRNRYGAALGGADDEVYRLTLDDRSERRQRLEQVFKDHPPAVPVQGYEALWQITLKNGTIVWNLHLLRLEHDTLVFRQDSATVRYPLMGVDELRQVRAGEHEIGPVAAGGRYDGAANGSTDMVYQLTLLDRAERRKVVEQILRARTVPEP